MMATANPYARIRRECRRTIVCGDIHGCIDELRELLQVLQLDERDILLTVGDFMDRGPGSWEVARLLRSLPNAHNVLGNHERRIAGTVRGTSKPAWSQQQTLERIPPEEWEEWAAYLEALPAVIETDEVIVTHARLDPTRPLASQDPRFTCAVGGAAVKIETDSDGVPLWFRQMETAKPICMGHLGYARVELVPGGLYALDTKAVAGGALTAVVLPERRVVQVPAARDYYKEALAEWRTSHAPIEDPLSIPLARLVALMSRGGDAKPSLEWLDRVNARLEALPLEDQAVRFRASLVERFGPVPDPGPARGAYFREMRGALGPAVALAHRVLLGKPPDLRSLASAFPAATLGDMEHALERLTPWR